MVVYLVETGILLDENDILFKDYNKVYGGEYGFMDEETEVVETLQMAKNIVMDYMDVSHNGSYGIVSKIEIPDDVRDIDEYVNIVNKFDIANVVYSAAIINSEVVIDFLQVDKNINDVQNSLEEIETNI